MHAGVDLLLARFGGWNLVQESHVADVAATLPGAPSPKYEGQPFEVEVVAAPDWRPFFYGSPLGERQPHRGVAPRASAAGGFRPVR